MELQILPVNSRFFIDFGILVHQSNMRINKSDRQNKYIVGKLFQEWIFGIE